jgi:hypothetical protein
MGTYHKCSSCVLIRSFVAPKIQNLPRKNEHRENILPNQDRKTIWLRVERSFGGFLTRKKLAKLLDQYFDPNNTCEEVVVGTVCTSMECQTYHVMIR